LLKIQKQSFAIFESAQLLELSCLHTPICFVALSCSSNNFAAYLEKIPVTEENDRAVPNKTTAAQFHDCQSLLNNTRTNLFSFFPIHLMVRKML
jgi:hypothetical protein